MLKRIKVIQNVGRFRHCTPPQVEFAPLTFVYGLNTYGKSTLGDIFSSLRTSDTSSIKARATIPADSNPQKIELSFAVESKPETTVRFANGAWSKNFPSELSLHVFDDGFYHKNLFSSRQFTRATKEAFSSFVLGEQGVAKTNEITVKNKQKNELTRDLGKITSHAFRDVLDLPRFLELKPEASSAMLDEKVASLRVDYGALQKQLGSIKKINDRKELSALIWSREFGENLKTINTVLLESMKPHQETARKAVKDHIAHNFQFSRGAEVWIRQGLSFHKGEDCLFCGQHLSLDALDLIDIYERSFDNSFETNSRRVNDLLSGGVAKITQSIPSTLASLISQNKEPIASYPELEDSEYFEKVLQFIANKESEILAALHEWDFKWPVFFDTVSLAVNKKRESPNLSLEPVDDLGLIELESQLMSLCSGYNNFVEHANLSIREFKATVNVEDLERRMKEILDQGRDANEKILRVKLAPQCIEYKSITQKLKTLAQEIPVLTRELKEEQSEFLARYFRKIDHYFKKFGSEDFELDKGEDGKGHTPIFYLKVKYRKHDISERNLEQVFSESDRRALALSVFWAGISESDPGKLENSIVVLDDPITSFDSNRMTAAHGEIVELSKKVGQIIILSHFEYGVAAFLQVYKNQFPTKLISINKHGFSSTIDSADIETFILTEHEKRRTKIFDFISAETDQHSAADLRVFFEIELSLRFAEQLARHSINDVNLSDRIDKLLSFNVVSAEVANSAHQFRVVLNPVHHIWLSNNIEDKRNTARDLVSFIYNGCLPLNLKL
jgi:wobble nucleotide-excising tRNase